MSLDGVAWDAKDGKHPASSGHPTHKGSNPDRDHERKDGMKRFVFSALLGLAVVASAAAQSSTSSSTSSGSTDQNAATSTTSPSSDQSGSNTAAGASATGTT